MAEANHIKSGETGSDNLREIVDKLLRFSQKMNKKRSDRMDESGERFNVFEVLNMTTNEVNCHSRFLHELLSPHGSHGMGETFLASFFEKALGSSDDLKLDDAKVHREFDCGDGRIDLLIEVAGKYCIVIEVKIYASDQHRQIARYSEFVRQWGERNPDAHAKDMRVYYLTLDGHEPSEFSVGESDAQYTCLSFKDDIVPWLESCAEASSSKPRLSETIRQYINTIETLTGGANMDEELEEVANEVIKSSTNYKAAEQIEKALCEGRIDLLRRIFGEIEDYLEKRLPGSNLTSVAEYEDIERYYRSSGSRIIRPRLRFRLAGDENYTLAFTVEVEDRLYMGLNLFKCDNSRYGFEKIKIDDGRDWLCRQSKVDGWQEMVKVAAGEDWWVDWCYIDDALDRDESNTNLIDFRNCPDNYAALYDDGELDKRMAKWTSNIDTYLKRFGH